MGPFFEINIFVTFNNIKGVIYMNFNSFNLSKKLTTDQQNTKFHNLKAKKQFSITFLSCLTLSTFLSSNLYSGSVFAENKKGLLAAFGSSKSTTTKTTTTSGLAPASAPASPSAAASTSAPAPASPSASASAHPAATETNNLYSSTKVSSKNNHVLAPLDLLVPEYEGHSNMALLNAYVYYDSSIKYKNFSGSTSYQAYMMSLMYSYLTHSNIHIGGSFGYQNTTTNLKINENEYITASDYSGSSTGFTNPNVFVGYLHSGTALNQYIKLQGAYPVQTRDYDSDYISNKDNMSSAPSAELSYTLYTNNETFMFGPQLEITNVFADEYSVTSKSSKPAYTYKYSTPNHLQYSLSLLAQMPKVGNLYFKLGLSYYDSYNYDSNKVTSNFATKETQPINRNINFTTGAKFKITNPVSLSPLLAISYNIDNDKDGAKVDSPFFYAAGAVLEVIF